MDPKYSNIFWHQGVKVFEDKILEGKKGQIKVAHLENDVTKALLNLFEHCSPKILGSFLKIVGVKQAAGAFGFDFQVTDTASYRRMPKRIMLSIVSASTQTISSDSYKVKQTIPDACIHSQDIAILIEVKTQSPLIEEQIQGHIKHYLGTATRRRVITWEDISERFRLIFKDLKGQDKFLVDQFCGFLDLIGMSEFRGFSEQDFTLLGSLGKIPDEDYADYKRLFQKKVTRFMALLKKEVAPILNFKNFDIYISKLPTQSVGTHSGFYFFNEQPDMHRNHFPNININYDDHCMELTFNAEIQSSVKRIVSCMKNRPKDLEKVVSKIPDMNLQVFYKLQYLPMDHFVWGLIPGFPKDSKTFNALNAVAEIEAFEKQWPNLHCTILYQMETGKIRHPSGRLYSDKELKHARGKNPKPNYAIRFGTLYSAGMIGAKQKKILPFFKKEISTLKPLAELVISP